MSALVVAAGELARTLAPVWVAGLWQGLALALAASGVLRLMPGARAGMRHAVLGSAALLLAVLPWLAVRHGGGAHGASLIHSGVWLAQGISVVWLLASLWRAFELLGAWRHLTAVARRARPVALAPALTEELRALGGWSWLGGRGITPCASPDVQSPAIAGFFHPRLLLPECLLPTLSEGDLLRIALHEREHLRRGDDWINLGEQLLRVLMPLNPGLLWLGHRMALERELACDAGVVARTAEPIAYARCLASLAERRSDERLRLALGALERRSELGRRIHALLGGAGWSPRRSRWAAAAATVLLALGGAAMEQVPAPVSFAPEATVAQATASWPEMQGSRVRAARSGDATLVQASYRVSDAAPEFRPRPEPLPVRVRSHRRAAAPRLARTATNALPSRAEAQSTALVGAVAPGDAHRTITPAHQAVLLPTKFVPTYAAVPFAGGWLIFQL